MLQEAGSAGIRDRARIKKSEHSFTNCVLMMYLYCAFQIMKLLHNLYAMLYQPTYSRIIPLFIYKLVLGAHYLPGCEQSEVPALVG